VNRLTTIVEKYLGNSGRMIGSSKGRYKEANPDNLVVFNSNIYTKSMGKIWYGDIDITLSLSDLKNMSREMNEEFMVLPEMAMRFEYENDPKLEDFVIIVKPDMTCILAGKYLDYKDTDGKLLLDTSIKYKDKHLTKVRCDDLFIFRSKKKERTPLDLFYSHIVSTVDKTQNISNIDISAVYVSENIYNTLEFLTQLCCRDTHRMDSYSASKTVMMEMFNIGPNTMEDTKANGIYVDREKLFRKEV
jgi:hypothetical protein